MDRNLPGMSGEEAVEKMRASNYSGVIVGMSTAARGEEMAAAGVDAFLGKPLEIPELLSVVAKLISEKKGAS